MEPVTKWRSRMSRCLPVRFAIFLKPQSGKRYLDGTLGGGGHTEKILLESSPTGQVLGLDWDDEALAAARARLSHFGARFISRQASFTAAKDILTELNWHRVDGAVLDLGVSSHHLDTPERGFSFRLSGRLDMRMDRRESLDAAEIVNRYLRSGAANESLRFTAKSLGRVVSLRLSLRRDASGPSREPTSLRH